MDLVYLSILVRDVNVWPLCVCVCVGQESHDTHICPQPLVSSLCPLSVTHGCCEPMAGNYYKSLKETKEEKRERMSKYI